jgi:hypothetical protein
MGERRMPHRTADIHVNPADEAIGTKGLAVRFLLTATPRTAASPPSSWSFQLRNACRLPRTATTTTKRRFMVSMVC